MEGDADARDLLCLLAKKQRNLPILLRALLKLQVDEGQVDMEDSEARAEFDSRSDLILAYIHLA